MEQGKVKVPIWFWIVAVFFFLWNLMGIGSFYMHLFISTEALDALSVPEKELFESYPAWTKVAFAVAVFGGFLGSIGLLLKKAWSKRFFIISLCAILPQMIYHVFITESMEVYGPGSVVMPIMVVAFGLLLIWFSKMGIKKNWLT
jgi:hypothetical protein